MNNIIKIILLLFSSNFLWGQAQILKVIEGHNRARYDGFLYNSEDSLLFSQNYSQTKIWDIPSGKLIKTIAFENAAFCRKLYNNNQQLINLTNDHYIETWDIKSGTLNKRVKLANAIDKVIFFEIVSKQGIIVLANKNKLGVWDINTGKTLAPVFQIDEKEQEKKKKNDNQDDKEIIAITLTNVAHEVIAGFNDQTINIINLKSGRSRKLGKHKDLSQLIFTPDGYLVSIGNTYEETYSSTSNEFTLKLWRYNYNHELIVERDFSLYNYRKPVGAVINNFAFNSDGTELALITNGNKIKIITIVNDGFWMESVSYNNKEYDLDFPKQILSIEYDENGRLLAFSNNDSDYNHYNNHDLLIWDCKKEAPIKALGETPDFILASEIDQKNNLLYTIVKDSSNQNNLQAWDLKDKKLMQQLESVQFHINDIMISADGSLIVGYNRNEIGLWEANSGRLIRMINDVSGIESIAFSPNNDLYLAEDKGEFIAITEIYSGKNILKIDKKGDRYAICDIRFSSNNAYLLISSRNSKNLELWDLNTRSLKWHLKEKKSKGIQAVAISPDGKLLAIKNSYYSRKRAIFIKKISNGETIKTINIGEDIDINPDQMYFEDNSQTLVTIEINGNKSLFQSIHVNSGNIDEKTAIPIPLYDYHSSNGKLKDFSLTSSNGGLKILDIKKGKELVTFYSFKDNTGWAFITPDQKFVADDVGIQCLYYIQDFKVLPISTSTPNFIGDSIIVKQELQTDNIISQPPQISWKAPLLKETKETTITIEAHVRSESEIITHNLFINDKRKNCVVEKNGDIITLRCKIDLLVGANELSLEAYNESGVGKSPKITINRLSPDQGNYYALIFAVEQYEDSLKWQNLPNVINGAQKLSKELEQSFGFTTEISINPTFKEMDDLLSQYTKKTYQPNDQLLIFFSGHGDAQKRGKQTVGFLVPQNASTINDQRVNYFRHADLGLISDGIPCPHLLIILDACFSSTFDTDITAALTGARPKGTYLKKDNKNAVIRDYLKNKSRLYFSAGETETLGGKNNDGSPFFEAFFSALINPENRNDGIVTFDEIKVNLMRANLNPIPKGGRFGSHEPGGSFIFPIKK